MGLLKKQNKTKQNKKIIIMGQLTRDLLLKPQELKIEKVDLGEGVFVYVKEMTGAARDAYERLLYSLQYKNGSSEPQAKTKMEHFRAKLVVMTICDEKGKLLLRPEDYATLSQNMGAARLETIVDAAQKLNVISKEDKEELTKNSKGRVEEDSNSDSAKD